MKKQVINYTLQGGYYLPNLFLPAKKENRSVGVCGQQHLRYIRQYRKVLYTNLLTSGKLNGYLADIDEQAKEMSSQLVKQMAEREGVIEQLKAENQMEWVGKMNALREAAGEIVNTELIFV